jgi:hypothetical protein
MSRQTLIADLTDGLEARWMLRRDIVLARGRMNSVLVEFADGYRVVTSRWAVRIDRTNH